MNKDSFYIDNITWNDLSLEVIYSRLNSCVTSAGEERLYERLRNPYIIKSEEFINNINLYDEIDRLIKAEKCENVENTLSKISKLNKYDYKKEIKDYENEILSANTKHYIIDILVIISFCLIFVIPGPGIVAFFGMIAYAVSDYFKSKNIISAKLAVFNYLIKIINCFKKSKIADIDDYYVINEKLNRLHEIIRIFDPFMRGTFIISEGAKTTSNPVSLLLDYIRMIFHVDIIKYNQMTGFIKEHIHETIELYDIVGDLDQAIAIANYKSSCTELCKPIFSDDTMIQIMEGYHPLLKNPVSNTIDTRDNILITGCNASGKSTFLKMIAINALFAQSFGFAYAKEYKATFFKIFSSMALRDDIDSGESYFVSEIKSLKRIIDSANVGNDKILCVIDEVLRGTNTVERIASSVEILKSLNKDNVLCFAATHDIELTTLLADDYKNYHFTETIKDDDVEFNYSIIAGAANTRNAIRLLSVLGYDEEIVNKASNRAENFLSNGVWN